MSTCPSLCKLLPENPTNHEDSRNSKEIQGVGSTLEFFFKCLESACFVGNVGTAKLFQEIPRCWNTLDIQEYSSSQNI